MPAIALPPRRSVLVIAHRGAAGECPENTRAAFLRALALGVDMLECDVQCTRDGTVVVIHDARVDRTTDGRGAVAQLSWQELRRLDAGSWFAPAFRGERIPTLEEVLALAAGKARVNVEIKVNGTQTPRPLLAQRVAEVIRRSGYGHGVVVSSFDAEVLAAFRDCCPEVALALLSRRCPREAPALLERLGAQALHLSKYGVSAGLLASLRAAGIPVRVFTVDKAREMRRLLGWGVDGIFTNHPARLLALLASDPAASEAGG
ncbi:MAG: glycerophosphoryl diester phosphodiesterase [Candidatus Tectimicrobiota bacterium]|nr:MAG: glycerophosphoryl diester phosphodiesterase [Candidatus Tectomicrobia bacterium]